MLRPLTDIAAIPMRGGCNTNTHKTMLPFGSYSMVQNLRGKHPGFRKRPGCSKLHTTADDTNECMSLYQFRKQRIDEKHLLAQFSDGDVLSATNAPPTTTTGVFGSEVYSGTGTGEVPAAYSMINDIMLYSNGVDQHQTYTGTANYIGAIVVYDGSAAPANIPEKGTDYSVQATDGLTTTVVVLDSLDTYANNECVFINTPVAATSLTYTVSKANGTVSTATLYYRKNDNTWADTSMTDGTKSGTTTLAQTGSMTWTAPSDEIPMYMYGQSGFWYQLRVSVQLDSEVELTKVTFGSGFQDLRNVWDGTVYAAVEVMVEGTTTYASYGSTSVSLDELASGKKIMIATTDRVSGFYVDIGSTPNATGTTITSLKYWDGSAMQSVGTISDGTSGLSNSGWITFLQKPAEPLQFQSSQYYAYWYELILDTTLSADVVAAFFTMPYFDIEKFGKGLCNATWKDRAIYAFTIYSNYIYVSANGNPSILNGDDYGILKAGDGRTNKVVAMRSFHNELMVFQEDTGAEGGSITNFAGYSPTTFGKLIISSSIGTFSNKTVDVVDGVMTSTETEENVKTLCFFLSRYGVCATDGLSISIISDDINNYFDPTESECIRRGYESKMWLEYDSAFNVIRVGLVSGSSATLPNVFPVFDLTDKVWYFDVLAQELSCITEIEADSGNIPVLQVGGGTDDGTVYLLNTGANDVSTGIDSFITMELNARGEYLLLQEVMMQMEAQNHGDVSVEFTKNSIQAGSKSLPMTPELPLQTVRRHRFQLNIEDQNISIKIKNDGIGEDMQLLSLGVKTSLYKER